MTLPDRVHLREVGPRDGFQNEPETIPTAVKVALIERLAAAGVTRLEATSFVRADAIPQLADAAEVLRAVQLPDAVSVSVLIPNERGLDAALALRERFDEVNVFLSASETHNMRNVNRSVADSLAGVTRVVERARAEGLRCQGTIATAFGCPYEGVVDPARVAELARALHAAGCEEIAFGDTTGMANPAQVRSLFPRWAQALPGAELTAHFHNTRGQGLANALAALDAGVTSFEASFGELGGCPVPSRLHRQRRQRGPRLDAPRDGRRDRDRPRPGCWRPRAPCRRSSGARSEPTSSPLDRWNGLAPIRVHDRLAPIVLLNGAHMPELESLAPVLVANRGEIAVRICRTLRRLGLRSVAVFSDADAGAPHVRAADAAVRIGPADARASYLSIEALLRAARATGARAVHPGYGFLAESAEFAQAVLDAGLTWIGPTPAAIQVMGDKAQAKQLARQADVPVVPGIEGVDLSHDQIARFCADHGFPVVVKAVAGGGGKGMRVVRAAGELEAAVASARREAQAAFGDERVLVERYLERPRHIEVQVLADGRGTVLHLGERECSLQRRHQKVVEEAPSPVVDPEWRTEMGAAAVALARACGYVGAGTVELIVPAAENGMLPDDFYFLEMNTRLQVEHPVTELVYGVDLVEQQLRVAAGLPLTVRQADLAPQGHAIEARLYAEDPAAGFLPSTGVVRRWRAPQGEGVRVDHALAEGVAVTTDYDPMIAKVIAHGPDRATAISRLQGALGELELLGVTTNAAFSASLLARPDVRAGTLDTGLLERVLADEGADVVAPPAELLAAAALTLALLDGEALARTTSVPLGWRSDGAPGTWRRRVTVGGDAIELVVAGSRVSIGEIAWEGVAQRLDAHSVEVVLDGVAQRCSIAAGDDGTLWIGHDGHQLELAPARAATGDHGAAGDALAAPMPGTVLLVHVRDGDSVREGDVLVVLESMKMELSVTAPHDGVVIGAGGQAGRQGRAQTGAGAGARGGLAQSARLPGENSQRE